MPMYFKITDGDETAWVRSSNTRTAIDRSFSVLCGRGYNLKPGESIRLDIFRLPGRDERAKAIEAVYQKTKKKKGEPANDTAG